MSQLAPASSGQPFGHNSYVPDMAYAYDVVHRTGRFTTTVEVIDLATIPAVNMGISAVCPFPWGACVSSVTGGVVRGYDMYGQYVNETIAAAGTGTIAFASVLSAPADVVWRNIYGLPYAYVSNSDDTPVDITITAPAANKDARGTFVYSGAFTSTHHATVTVAYIANTSNLMGDRYSTRFDTADPGSVALAVTATLVAATGVAVVTVPVSTPAGVKTTITFPDGHTVRGVAGTPVNHTLSPVWLSQYMDVTDAAAADRLIAVAFDGGFIAGTYANVTVS